MTVDDVFFVVFLMKIVNNYIQVKTNKVLLKCC